MPRWRLTAAHYLNVPGTEWEHKETDRDTGRQARKVFPVPAYLEAETIVAYEGIGQRGDTEFIGDPTPDMEPLDDEAEALSEARRPFWIHPIESLAATGAPVPPPAPTPQATVRRRA